MSRSHPVWLGLACSVFLASAGALAAQESNAGGAYLNTHFEAQELLSRAANLAADGHWAAAASVYHDAIERFGANLVAGRDGRFGCVRDEVCARIAQWPREGLDAYRDLYEKPAHAACDAALRRDDDEAARHVAERYFPTRAGAEALQHVARRAFERGDFQSARRLFERLAAQHPDRDETLKEYHNDRSAPAHALVWRAQAAFCAAATGLEAPLEALIQELESSKAAARVPWGGQDRSILDWLIQCRADAAFLAQIEAATACPFGLFAAGPSRGGRYPSRARADARLWKYWDTGRAPVDAELSGYESGVARRDAWLRMVQSGRLLAAVPAADCTQDGRPWLYVHDGRAVWAVDPLRTDQPAWRFEFQAAPAVSPSWTSEDEPPPQFTCLVADGRVYAPLEREMPPTSTGQTLISSVLVCLDAATGTPIWENDLSAQVSAFEEARLDGAPLLHDGRLYAILRKRKPFGFEACLLLRFNPGDGRVIWSTHLGESATGSYGYRRPTLTHAAAAGDLVFVQTNLGAVAAVSAVDGHVRWLRTYPSRFDDSADGFWPSRLGRPIRAWQYAAPVVWRDAIIVLPLDLDKLCVLGQYDGEERFSVDLDNLGNPEQIVGVEQNVLYLAGTQVTAFDLLGRGAVWQRPLEVGQLFGRAALTADSLWVPATSALLRYRLRGGPVDTLHWSQEEAGNVLPLADQLVIASAKGLYGLAGKAEAFADIERQLQHSGNDPDVALALAELAFNTGETQRGLDAVRLAVEKMGGFARITSDMDRRRLFKALTQFAYTMLARPQVAATHPAQAETAVTLFRMAGQCAQDTDDQIAFRFGLARAYVEAGQPNQAVLVYQQILSDDALRNAKVGVRPEWTPAFEKAEDSQSDGGPVPSGTLVESWIGRLILAHGRAVYDSIESQAQARLKLASADSDPDSLLNIAQTFPNSRASRRARVLHARRAEDRLDWPAALQSYRAALWTADAAEKPEIIRLYAACLARAGKRDLAAIWLHRAVRDYPEFRFDLDGRRVGFDAYRVQLLGEPRYAVPVARDWAWGESWRRVFADRVHVLDPTASIDAVDGTNLLLTFSGNQIEARRPVTGRSLWNAPAACSNLPQFVAVTKGKILLTTTQQLIALRSSDGQPGWVIGSDPPADPMADPEDAPGWTTLLVAGPRLFAVSDLGDILCVDHASGEISWKRRVEAGANHHLVADDTRVCYASWQGRKHAIQIIDARSGEILHNARSDEDGPIQRLAMTHDGDVLLLFSNALQRVNTVTGTPRWRAAGNERFHAAVMHLDDEGVVVSPDGRRLARHDIDTGRVLWTSDPLANGLSDGLWTQVADGVLYAACGNNLAAYDLGDGRRLWHRALPPAPRADAPRLTSDSIFLIVGEKSDADQKLENTLRVPPRRYRVMRFARSDGRECRVTPSGPLLTEPLTTFGGFHVFDDALLIVDGSRLIGYAASKE